MMKKFFTFILALAMPAMVMGQTNRTPINRGFLQSNLDLNGKTATNGYLGSGVIGIDPTNQFASGRRIPFWVDDGGPSPGGGGTTLHEMTWGTNVSILIVDHKNGEVVFYYGGSENTANSFRVAGPGDGNPDPRMTFAFTTAGDELDRTYSLHTNGLQLKYAGAHQNFVWTDNYLDKSIMFGGTNASTKMQGTNLTFYAGTSTTPLQALNIQSNRNIQIGAAGHDGKLEFWDDSGGGFSGAGIGFDSAQSSMRIYVTGLIIDGNSSFNGIVFMPQGTSVGGGATLLKVMSATAALDFPLTSAQNSADLTITVNGAATGDTVDLGVPTAAILANSDYTAWVSAANTVTVRFNNYSAGAQNPTSGTFRAQVNHF
jgi:hypothetical protein